ncbi:hypothetical protein HOY80DRAFT_1021894 [Tuber brumale]|nr:hypothetical protein HOY80DRAFT_1021894 [Tuber brumale]
MATQILQVIKEALENRNHELLVFTELDPKVSSEILDNLLDPLDKTTPFGCRIHFVAPDGYLRVVMPTALHETAFSWITTEFFRWAYDHLLTPVAISAIECGHITYIDGEIAYENFVGGFEGSSKTPDLSCRPRIDGIRREFPTVVLESGWAESEAQSLRDLQLWQEGSAGAVRIVIFFKMSRPSITNQIKATLKICRYGAGNAPIISSYQIFPTPAQPVADPWITMDELFGGNTPSGLNPETQLPLSVNRLRREVEVQIRQQGHEPAVN